MASDWQDDDGLPEKRPEDHAHRQSRRRAQVIRRRIAAVGSLVVVAVAIVIVINSAGTEDDSGKTSSHAARARQAAKKAKAAAKAKSEAEPTEVRNSTPQAGWKPYTGPVPILEYHDLGSPPEGTPDPELSVGRTDFANQMNWLDEHGYQAVTLEQVQEAWHHGGTLPPKPIVLSFDDGYRPQYTFALPALREHGWAGVLNLRAEGSDLYQSNVEEMIAAGWELASQTINQPDLTELGSAELEEEVSESRQILKREFKVPVENFSYPAGKFDETVVAAVEAAGYSGATTEVSGLAEKAKPFELARLEILRETHVAGLAEALKNGEGEGEGEGG